MHSLTVTHRQLLKSTWTCSRSMLQRIHDSNRRSQSTWTCSRSMLQRIHMTTIQSMRAACE